MLLPLPALPCLTLFPILYFVGRFRMMKHVAPCALVFLAIAGSANAFEFRCRFVERVGTADVVLAGNNIDGGTGLVRNIRLQFGVFDDASGPAPAGGFVGWNVGSMVVAGEAGNSAERRSPGRLSPFNFASGPNSNGNPPAPEGDPFTMLTEIDATLGTQSPIWQCDGNGQRPPPPPALVRGRNTYVSVFAFSIDPVGISGYTVTVGGNAVAATSWQVIGTPTPPACGDPSDPSDDVTGDIIYAPFPTEPRAISCVLTVYGVPTPGSATFLGVAGLIAARRRRI